MKYGNKGKMPACGDAGNITQTSRHRDSAEYRDEVIESPYYTSFPKSDGKSEKQPAGDGGSWVD